MKQTISFAKCLHLSALISGILTVLLICACCLAPTAMHLALAITAGTTFYHFAMRLLVGFVIPRLCRKPHDPNGFWFRSRPLEAKLYRRLNVRRWKNKMPTYAPDSFSLHCNTLPQILQNSCEAELVHWVIVALSFLPILASLRWGAFPVFLITSILSAMFDGIFIVMQRYNRPRLLRAVNSEERRLSHDSQ